MEAPVLIGGGGHARSLTAMAPAAMKPQYYVDPCRNMSLAYLGDDDVFLNNPEYADMPVLITFVAPEGCSMAPRRRIIERYSGRRFATVIAPDAVVEPDSVTGSGTMIFHKAVINTGVFLGDHVIVNTGAIVEHDSTVGHNVFIGPGAIICGEVTVGNDCYIGAGAILKNGITIPDGTIIGMGAVVTKTLRTPGFYFGNRAKKIK